VVQCIVIGPVCVFVAGGRLSERFFSIIYFDWCWFGLLVFNSTFSTNRLYCAAGVWNIYYV